jgi:hypothetical protein
MSFRQKNDTNRKWNAFYQANRELIAHIGLPGPIVDTYDQFVYFMMHDYDPLSAFDIKELSPEKRDLLKSLVEKYFEAGFSNPGIGPWLVGGEKEFLRLVRQYPKSFNLQYLKWANEQD